jgi:hypothetical protein
MARSVLAIGGYGAAIYLGISAAFFTRASAALLHLPDHAHLPASLASDLFAFRFRSTWVACD